MQLLGEESAEVKETCQECNVKHLGPCIDFDVLIVKGNPQNGCDECDNDVDDCWYWHGRLLVGYRYIIHVWKVAVKQKDYLYDGVSNPVTSSISAGVAGMNVYDVVHSVRIYAFLCFDVVFE